MKKNSLSLLAVVLFLSLAACAKKPTVDTAAPPQTATEKVDAAAESRIDTVVSTAVDDESAGRHMHTAIALQSTGKLDTIYFDYDSFVLTAEARKILETNAQRLRENAAGQVVIKGHTDERGSDAYNLALGERRARAAYGYLVALGIPAERLSIISYGEEQPAVGGQGEESWGKNRRAEF